MRLSADHFTVDCFICYTVEMLFPYNFKNNRAILADILFGLQLPPPTCRWHRVSSERSLSRLLALSFCGLLGWRSFSEVLLPRLPATLGSCLKLGEQPVRDWSRGHVGNKKRYNLYNLTSRCWSSSEIKENNYCKKNPEKHLIYTFLL